MAGHVCKCPEGGHPTFGACVRSKNLRIAYAASSRGWDASKEKAHQRELDAYADARRQGIQPDGTRMAQVEKAVQISNETGSAYGTRTPG